MNKKIAPYILIVVLAVAVMVVRKYTSNTPLRNENDREAGASEKQRGFNRLVRNVEYTAHARCRMDCRKVSAADIQGIIKEGKINYRKSDLQDKPCPTYALEGYTDDNEHLRIVFAQCQTKTKVVTCINLEEEFVCQCPGDAKADNR